MGDFIKEQAIEAFAYELDHLGEEDDSFDILREVYEEKQAPTRYYETVSVQVRRLSKSDLTDLSVQAELGAVIEQFTPLMKVMEKVDNELKPTIKKMMEVNRYPTWELGNLTITPTTTGAPTKQCLDDPEYQKLVRQLERAECLLATIKTRLKEVKDRPGYTVRKVTGYARRVAK